MNFRGHYILECCIMIPLGILLLYIIQSVIIIPMIGISIILGAVLPDCDLKLKRDTHRNIYFHSLFFPLLFMAMSWMSPDFMLFLAILGVGIGVHLLGDMKLSGRQGYYCIAYGYDLKLKVKRLNGKNTTYWLLGNFIASLVILVAVAGWLL